MLVAPALLVGLARRREQYAWRLALLASYIGPVAASRYWGGGWSPSARLWVPIIPVLGICLFEFWGDWAERRGGLRIAGGLLAAVSLGWGALYALFPDRRCGKLGHDGANYFIDLAGRLTHLPVAKLVPYFQVPAARDYLIASVALVAWVAASAALSWRLIRAQEGRDPGLAGGPPMTR